MAALKSIKDKIQNTATVGKVTVSMKNIASAKLAVSRNTLMASRKYFELSHLAANNILNVYMKRQSVPTNSPVYTAVYGNKELPVLLLLITSNRGLCGGYNNNAIKKLHSEIKHLKSQNKKFVIMTLGKKGFTAVSKVYDSKCIINVTTDVDVVTQGLHSVDSMCYIIRKQIIDNKIGAVKVIYTQFKNVLEQSVQLENIIPCCDSIEDVDIDRENLVTDDKVLSGGIVEVLFNYLRNIILEVVLNSVVSEHSTRVAAMDQAHNNANDLVDKYTLTYNKARQNIITQELTEIISGAEAI